MLGVWSQGGDSTLCLPPEASWGLAGLSVVAAVLWLSEEEVGGLWAVGPVQGGQCHGRGLPRRHIPRPVLSLHPLSNILHSWASSVPGDTVTLFLVTLWGVEAWSRHHPARVVWQQGNTLLLDRASIYSTLSHALPPSWTLITPQGGWGN